MFIVYLINGEIYIKELNDDLFAFMRYERDWWRGKSIKRTSPDNTNWDCGLHGVPTLVDSRFAHKQNIYLNDTLVYNASFDDKRRMINNI